MDARRRLRDADEFDVEESALASKGDSADNTDSDDAELRGNMEGNVLLSMPDGPLQHNLRLYRSGHPQVRCDSCSSGAAPSQCKNCSPIGHMHTTRSRRQCAHAAVNIPLVHQACMRGHDAGSGGRGGAAAVGGRGGGGS